VVEGFEKKMKNTRNILDKFQWQRLQLFQASYLCKSLKRGELQGWMF
jgi:hypothetical protein